MASDAQHRPDPALAAEHDVGPQLRVERVGRGISLRALARTVGISPSALSQIETGRSKPSVGTLYALVTELGLSLDELFSGVPATAAPALAPARSAHFPDLSLRRGHGVQTATTRQRIAMEAGVTWERLTPTSEPDVDFLHVIYDVNGASSRADSLMRHSGREYGLVLEGRLRVTVGDDEHDLGPGDSIAFDSSLPHRLENIGDSPVRAVWFALGRYGATHQ